MPFTEHRLKSQSGFTLIEVMVLAPVVLIAIAIFVGIIVNLTGEILVTRGTNTIAFNTQDALDMIEQDVRVSAGFLATNSITPLVSPQGYGNNTEAFPNASTSTGSKLVLRSVGLTDTSNNNRRPVWLSGQPAACSDPNVRQNSVMLINTIYFVRENTLWRRVIMPSNYTTAGCSTPDQQPSCHPSQTGAICVTSDVRVLDNVSEFNLSYFSPSSQDTAISDASSTSEDDATRQVALDTANTVRISLEVDQTIAGRDVSYGGVLRATRAGSIIE